MLCLPHWEGKPIKVTHRGKKKSKTKNQAMHNLADEPHSDYVNHIIKRYAEQPIR